VKESAPEALVVVDVQKAFVLGSLESLLSDAGVHRLSICGLTSEMCVAATARSALGRGFGVILARDAHATYDVPEDRIHAPAVPAHLASRVAEWSLGTDPAIVDRSADLAFHAVP